MESFKIPRTKRAIVGTEAVPLQAAPSTVPQERPQEELQEQLFGGLTNKKNRKTPSITPQIFRLTEGSESDLKVVTGCRKHTPNTIEEELRETKKLLDKIQAEKYQAIRNNNNPYERISFFFQNRAAFKMVELDHHFKLVPPAGKSYVVADICSGPGGFSEYVLTKLKWKAKVFGFTLRNRDDFRVDNFNVSSTTETFHAYYGPPVKKGEMHETPRKILQENTLGNGDITSLENLKGLARRIGEKVDLVTADGGFEISDYNMQELFARKMLLGEFITPLMILKEGGDFVCKLFTTFTEFSYDLLFLATCLYNEVYFTKPISSRVANSERFLVCKGFRGISSKLLAKLQELLLLEGEIPEGSTQAAEVPNSFLDHSSESWKVFRDSLDKVNEKVTKTQIYHLNNIIYTNDNPRNKKREEANVVLQNEIAERVSATMKIHRDPRQDSPEGYLWYSPLYGQKFADPKVALEHLKGAAQQAPQAPQAQQEQHGGAQALFLVKTGFGKRPRAQNIYFLQDGKVTKPFGELTPGLVETLPFDTIVEVERNEETGILEMARIVYSFLPPGYGEHDYSLLKKNAEIP